MEQEIDRFEAKADDGTVYTIIEYQEFTEHRPVDSPNTEWVKGMKRLELEDGSPVNAVRNDPETFQIVATDQIVRRIR